MSPVAGEKGNTEAAKSIKRAIKFFTGAESIELDERLSPLDVGFSNVTFCQLRVFTRGKYIVSRQSWIRRRVLAHSGLAKLVRARVFYSSGGGIAF